MKYTFFIVLISLCFTCFGQNSGTEKAFQILQSKREVYFTFTIENREQLNSISRIISIDSKTKPGSLQIFAYANTDQFQKFLLLQIPFEILISPGDLIKNPVMQNSLEEKKYTWDSYPTYQTYLDILAQFHTDYADLCNLFQIGTSVMGRKLMFVKLTSNVNTGLLKPRIMLTSSIHGDEIVGYVTLLHLIDYLLSNYGVAAKTTSLLDNYEIWINPLANPDGTYMLGNNTVSGAVRFNANAVDLNRNFPDFVAGQHPDGKTWQPENIAMMHFADSLQFVVSINLHSGAEVVNYPWDTKVQRHADDNWWQVVSKKYADTLFAHSTGNYFTSINQSGYTNGSDWYIITGGRQDYMNYYHNCREFTLEISDTKVPAASTLPVYWESNYRSLINYVCEASGGFNGTVTDSITGAPLHASVTIVGHDADNSNVFSELPFGNYFRPVFPGNYVVSFAASGYKTKSYTVNTTGNTSVLLNAQLVAGNSNLSEIILHNDIEVFPNPAGDFFWLKFAVEKQTIAQINLINLQGEIFKIDPISKNNASGILELNCSALPKGIYFLQIVNQHNSVVKKIVIK